ncbi:MAG: hypothetical protein HC915_15165 [Anaerolineae bacterium]|nr:hypothetical protein [Anaerolineae bacterium]
MKMNMLRRWTLLGLIALLGVPWMPSAAQELPLSRTTAEVDVRACPSLTCDVLFDYPANAPLVVEEVVSGDEVAGDSQWVRFTDSLRQVSGYIPLSLTDDYAPQRWQTQPVVPEISETVREIYQRGLELGNNPAAFSKVGDCQNVSSFFLAQFDRPEEYALGEYAALQGTIDHFAGSWERTSAAVDNGFNVASVLSPLWSDPAVCEAGETPLECEYRLHRPSIVIISMETWWGGRPAEEYEAYLSQIVEFWIEHGVVPILGTKADNLEGDHGLNQAVARVANYYDIPLWNFWLAVQPLPNHGLTVDNFHLTFARNFFDDPNRLQFGWPVRNLTALQAIDAVFQAVSTSDNEE